MSDIITQNILADRCILDGEMLVWNTSTNRFAEFGSNQEIAKAAKEGLDSDRQLCYIAFDILYVGDTSVIHQTLRERHNLLCKYVKPIKGRLEILVPNGSLSTIMPFGEPCWSLIARSAEDVEKFFKETIENRDEGIVLKDLNSKWEPSDRSGKWLKLKPEYVRAGSDLDVLVIGGYYGSGRHGGEVAQFLVGLAERPEPNTHPRRFMSFCRVGTGLSDEELDAVVTKLKPHFRKYEYPKKAPPSFYQVTNNSKERPDVWVESPERSIILSITSDIRTIKSEVFAAPYSLRFPRIDRVKFDKPWYECLDVQTFVDLVHSSNGTTRRGADFGDVQDHKPKRLKSTRTGEKKNVPFVPSHLIQTDVSNVKGETLIFSKMVFYFANVPSSHSLDLLHKMVVENGGSFSMNLNKSVTHCIAAESRGIKFHAAKLSGDVINYSWLLECCLQRKLLPLQPKYFLYLSEPSKEKLREEIDEFSDSYYLDVEIEDLKQMFSSFGQSEDPKTIDYYKKKYCPKDKWIRFHGCYIYFCLPPETFLNKSEWKILLEFALRRMKVKVSCGGGSVGASLSHATHLVVMTLPGLDMNLDMVLSSLSVKERHLLLSSRLHIVTSKWLEDSLMADQKLPEDSYSLKSNNFKELVSRESGNQELNLDSISCSNDPEVQCVSLSDKEVRKRKGQAMINTSRLVTLPKKEDKTKRGTSSRNHLQKRTGGIKQMRRVRPRVGNKPVKINENDLDGSGSENGEDNESCKTHCKLSPEIQDSKEIDNFVSSQPEETSRQDAGDKSCQGERSSEIHEVLESGSGNGARVDYAIDPLQAMLRDMIPVLGSSEVKSMDRVLGDEKSPVQGEKTSSAVLDSENKIPTPPPDPNSMPEKRKIVSFRDLGDERPPMQGEEGTSAIPHSENEIPLPDPSSVPEKRKKVSYKDLAAELLKEW